LGILLEKHFGAPQDVEWAIDRDLELPKSIILLQTRPAIMAQKKAPVDQVVDLMLNLFSKG
jgi:pyruvate,water dikinase